MYNHSLMMKLLFFTFTGILVAVPISLVAGKPAHPPCIFIDPGHGGVDSGAVAHGSPLCYEKNLTLALALLVEENLKKLGFRVAMSRRQDLYLSLKQRVEKARELESDLFVSIHFNAAANEEAHGTEIYYPKKTDQSTPSKAIAEPILKGLVKKTGLNSRGVKGGNYYVLRESVCPAILIEVGFLTNEEDLEAIREPTFLRKAAFAIAGSIGEQLSPQRVKEEPQGSKRAMKRGKK